MPHPLAAITTSQEGQGSPIVSRAPSKAVFLQDMEVGIYVFTFSGSMAAFAAGMHCSI